jgi:hypothetical protein
MTAARHRRRRPEQRPRYALIIEGRGGGSDIHALRALLKQLLRRYHFRALDVREETEPERITYTQVFTELRCDVQQRRAARISPHHDQKETSS